jgi:hypothetical protein
MEREPILRQPWSVVTSAFVGAYVGSMAALAHEVYTLLLGRFNDSDPFLTLVSTLAVANLGGAVLFAIVAWVHNGATPQWSPHLGLAWMTSRSRASNRFTSAVRRSG